MSPGRDSSATPSLPPSVEDAYRHKCIQLRQRMQEVEQANDEYRARRERLVRGIRKMRLERAILLETLGKRMKKGNRGPPESAGAGAFIEDETDDSTDSPPTPQERPMRIKRSHRRPDASFIHESTPSRPTGSGAQETGSNRDDAAGPGSEVGGGDDGVGKDEDMGDAAGGAGADGDERRQSAEYGGEGNANNGDAHSNAGDSEMGQD